ncbi:MAG TPA: S41 family peptidase [Victivallales bacterium]|nr:S41 family peptidase [Victivallales bacterium]
MNPKSRILFLAVLIILFQVVEGQDNSSVAAGVQVSDTVSSAGPDLDKKLNDGLSAGKVSDIKPEEPSVSDQLSKKLSEIISEIEKFCPQFIDRKQEFYSNGIRGFLEEVSPELDYVPDEKDIPKSSEVIRPEFHRPLIFSSHKILYIRIDGFSEENFKKLKSELSDISRLANPPVGVAIDLRSSSGNNGMVSAEYASLFSDDTSVSFVKNEDRGIIKLPLMILIGSKTSGDAEIFAALIMKSGKALLVGEKSVGAPFARFPIKLNNGGILLVPDIPTDLAWLRPSPLQPSINIRAYPQVEYSMISGSIGSEESDECIRRVSDLLVSLDAIQKDKEKKK